MTSTYLPKHVDEIELYRHILARQAGETSRMNGAEGRKRDLLQGFDLNHRNWQAKRRCGNVDDRFRKDAVGGFQVHGLTTFTPVLRNSASVQSTIRSSNSSSKRSWKRLARPRRRRPCSTWPMPSRISQTVMDASPRPFSAMESKKVATRGSGRGRIISETTLASINHASRVVISRSRWRTTAACNRGEPQAEVQRRCPPRNNARTPPTVWTGAESSWCSQRPYLSP